VHSPKLNPNKVYWWSRRYRVWNRGIEVREINVPVAALRVGLALMIAAAVWFSGAAVAGPVETNVFAVQGVQVDVTSTDANAAKNQALMDVQVKAFFTLIERLGSADVAASLRSLKPEEIAPYLKSLSIEQESSAPGRYIGTFTVRFLPEKITQLLESYGIKVPTSQSRPIIVLPIFQQPAGPLMWEDNPWRKAWLDLRAEQALVPLIIPLGDLEDTETLTATDALNADPVKLEALRRRYGTTDILVAVADPADGGSVHVSITGDTTLGHVIIDKIYTADDGRLESSVEVAAQRIHAALLNKFKSDEARAMAEAQIGDEMAQSISVTVPFTSPTEWNGIRSRILSTPNVRGVDLSTLSGDGAVIRLIFTNTLPALQANLQRTGLTLAQNGESWVIQPM
jgi:hypothetical protein